MNWKILQPVCYTAMDYNGLGRVKNMRKNLIGFMIALLLFGSISTTAFASAPGTVDSYVNFRSAPATSSTVLFSLKPGTTVNVIESVNAWWLKVEVNGIVGYVSSNYVTISNLTQPLIPETPAPSTTTITTPLSNPPSPTNITSATNNVADKVIMISKSLIGVTRYQFGVNQAPTIMDCSAFTKYVYSKVGIPLKWGTRYQKEAGSYVPRSNLQSGDLLFFRVGTSTDIKHVGIYIGNGQFIHNSPSMKGIGISSLTSGYWSTRYVTARRVI
jgi:cell wall-associated NlpC family hydrolase